MSRSFLKFMLSVFVVAALATASFAQDDANMARPNTKSGSAAWMFSFGGLSTLGLNQFTIAGFTLPSNTTGSTFNSTVFGAGYKYYLADDLALRAMLGFNSGSAGDADITTNPTGTGKTSQTVYGIGVGVEMHTHAVYSTSPYFGAQLSFAGSSYDNTKSTTEGTTTVTNEIKASGTTFAIAVLAGFDWYFTKGIAVGGEYSLGFGTTSMSETVTTAGTSTSPSLPSSTNIGISSGNVHLVVHF
jgi:hypothetical protein